MALTWRASIIPWLPSRLLDISRSLHDATAAWPGDVPFSYTLGMKIAKGASVNVGSITTSLHTATHCDAPYHFSASGITVEQIPLDTFVGPAWVVDVSKCLNNWLTALDVLPTDAERVLFYTGGWPDSSTFPETIPVMSLEVVEALAARSVRLIGVDLPSVDPLDSKELPVHHALGQVGITIVEGLWLEGIRPGRYKLLAAPLKLMGTDGSPMRALLECL
ncbi:MAG TPA: cyclase family protein [Gemmatales bacterium]|nr:cyclase family protein [Gemmatales bacterium]